MVDAQNIKLFGYVLIAIFSLAVAVKLVPMLRNHYIKDHGSPAYVLLLALFLDAIARIAYFAYWTIENIANHPDWMLNSWSIITITWLKVLAVGAVTWLIFKAKKENG